jgi:hypothetical protein
MAIRHIGRMRLTDSTAEELDLVRLELDRLVERRTRMGFLSLYEAARYRHLTWREKNLILLSRSEVTVVLVG